MDPKDLRLADRARRDLGEIVDEGAHPPPGLPEELRAWFVRAEGVNSVLVLLPEDEGVTDPDELRGCVVAAPWRTVLKGWKRHRSGYVVATEVPYDHQVGVLAAPGEVDTTCYLPGEAYVCATCGEMMSPAIVHETGWVVHPTCAPPQAPDPERAAGQVPAKPAAVSAAAQQPPPATTTTPTTTAERPAPKRTGAGTAGRASTGPSRPAAVGLDLDTDGQAVLIRSGGISKPVDLGSIRHYGHLVELARSVGTGTLIATNPAAKLSDSERRWKTQPGQILVTRPVWEAMGLFLDLLDDEVKNRAEVFAELTQAHPVLTEAQDEGWVINGLTEQGGLKSWSVGFNERAGEKAWDATRVIAVPALFAKDPLMSGEPGCADLVERLQLFADSARFPWTSSGSRTGRDLALLTRSPFAAQGQRSERRRLFDWAPPTPAVEAASEHNEISWYRAPTPAEQELRYVHAYDVNAAYLNAARSQPLPVGPWREADLSGINWHRPPLGWWLVTLDEPDPRFPNPLSPYSTWDPTHLGRQIWVTTPSLKLAVEWDQQPEVTQGYVWDEQSKVLEGWAKRLINARDAAAAADPAVGEPVKAMVKATYVQGLGMLGAAKGNQARASFANLDRHRLVIARSRELVLRKIRRIWEATGAEEGGRLPLAVSVDTIVYASDNPDPRQAWPLNHTGRAHEQLHPHKVGYYKPERSGLMSEQLPWLTSTGDRKWHGKKALVDPEELT